MPAIRKCPECGLALPADIPLDACPKCLLKAGLRSQPERGRKWTSAELLQPGDKFGHYEIIRSLGNGGMGSVYEAHDLETGRRVALKVLALTMDSPTDRQRFLREGQTAARLNHPNCVYVFGAEEVDGIQAISMELVPGGTLQQRVQSQGPLAISEAVDVMLQIIAGLEAAEAIGILHRDIKPANCFLDSDGTAKVGDFGLAISTAARGETDLTITGLILATPAFASPEQLRGQEFTARSDIYAVGVTLYYLLTGKLPFESKNLVQLLTLVVTQRADSPAKWRREIPKGLCQVVLRCLQKQPSERYTNYAQLRGDLLTYGSTAPTAATLGLRFLAGCIDICLLVCLGILVMPFHYPHFMRQLLDTVYNFPDIPFHAPDIRVVPAVHKEVQVFLSYLFGSVFPFLYFGVLEGIWGASLGKAICGLRVINANRSFPGIPRALLRSAIYNVFTSIPEWLLPGFDASRLMSILPVGLLSSAALALLFVTARRKNYFASVHDLLSNTRVIGKFAYLAPPAQPIVAVEPTLPETAQRIGPYRVMEVLRRTDSDELLLCLDARLQRPVWVRKVPPGTLPVSTQLRGLSRLGRLRWLNGFRSPEQAWDAYEAVSGKPLLKLLNERQSWEHVRVWLLDLAEELSAGLRNRALPVVLELDRVWISADGHAKVLDFPAPGIDSVVSHPDCRAATEVPPGNAADSTPQQFLRQVAATALLGRADAVTNQGSSWVSVPLPLYAREFLIELDAGRSLDSLVERLKRLLRKPARVSRRRRLLMVAGCSAWPLFTILRQRARIT